MQSKTSFSVEWSKVAVPRNEDELGMRPLSGTNVLLLKSMDHAFGLCLHGIKEPKLKKNYLYLDIGFDKKKEMVVPGKGVQKLKNCLTLMAESDINSSILALILDQLFVLQPDGNFQTVQLFKVLDDVEKILKRPKNPPTREEVIGVWGELYFMLYLLRTCANHHNQIAILNSWEGEHREKIDFRFVSALHAVEVKSTLSENRDHHINGLGQVTVPLGFKDGTLASISLTEIPGYTCSDLLSEIEATAMGTPSEIDEFKQTLAKRILVRGHVCEDERFSFDLSQSGMIFFNFDSVPSPSEADNMIPLEWIAKLGDVNPMKSSDVSGFIRKITSSS